MAKEESYEEIRDKEKKESNSASDEAEFTRQNGEMDKYMCGTNCNCNSILGGFKLGFGIFLAFLTGWCLVSLVAIAIYFLAKLF